MSYYTWTTYGYGICITPSEALSFMPNMPAFIKQSALTTFDVEEAYSRQNGYKPIEEMDYEDLNEIGNDIRCDGGIAGIIASVMTNVYNIPFTSVYDVDGNMYVLYAPSYPWLMIESDLKIMPEFLDNCFAEQMAKLTDQKFKCDYQSAENCG